MEKQREVPKKEVNKNSDAINEEYEAKIEKLIKTKKRDRKIKIILIIIIIILLIIFWLLGFRIGKIGYIGEKETGADTTQEVLIKITNGDIDIDKNTKLEIFKNEKFNGKEIIAPNSSGSYQFCIKNESENYIVYHIYFVDEMNYFVNMKYRLKIDNIYIRGNENSYVGIDELDVENITVLKNSINLYTLEWYWEDEDEADSLVGSKQETQYYTLGLRIIASLYDEKE